jgi:formate-dependent nitrite reductase membrane component NrfD
VRVGPPPATPSARPPAPTVALMPAVLQHEWDLYHATWFTLMGIGGGIFLVSRLLGLERGLGAWLGLPVVDLVSFVVIGVGGLVLLVSLGRPLRFLRAVLRPRTSWISRGAIADFVFLVVGALLIAPGLTLGGTAPLAVLPWDPWASTGAGLALEVVALLASAVVIVYAGLVLADKAAVTFWRSWLVPTQFVLSSLAMSMATIMVMAAAAGTPVDARECWLLAVFLALLLAAVVRHVTTDTARPGKAEAVARLRGTFGAAFHGGVVAGGIVAPLALAVLGALWPAARAAAGVLALIATVGGGFGLRLLTLRVGYFPPISAPFRVPKR